MIPLVSKEKAQILVSKDEYSCPRKVLNIFHHNGDDMIAMMPPSKRMLLLQNSFGEDKSGAVRNHAKLSKHIYNLMTATDPDALISDI